MWCPLFFLLLIGAASGKRQVWKVDTEYQYHVESKTLTGLHDFSSRYSGFILRGLLTIRPKSEETLEAKFSDVHYAEIHEKFASSYNWTDPIPDSILNFQPMPMSEKIFEIRILEFSVIGYLVIDKDVPVWEINLLKSIVSQLQVHTPSNPNNFRYKIYEETVGGDCEVQYTRYLAPYYRRESLNLKPELRGSDWLVTRIDKRKDYCRCRERMNDHCSTKWHNWDPCKKDNGKSLNQTSVGRVILTSNGDNFTIQSSSTIHQVMLSPSLHENKKGLVGSMVNVTLIKMDPVPPEPWPTSTSLLSVGSLVYDNNNPFLGRSEAREENHRCLVLKSRPSRNRTIRNIDTKRIHGRTEPDSIDLPWPASDRHTLENNRNQRKSIDNLNEPPKTLLLPFFVDTQGESTGESGPFDLVMKSTTLIYQIGHDLEDPNSITDKHTLEKFTILVTLIRAMNTSQIAGVEREIDLSNNVTNSNYASERIGQNRWSTFRDAVAQAGTGPALITIKKWIKEMKIEGVEAALLVAVLSKTVEETSPEYLNAFFEMVTMPETTNQEFLNATAMVTFGDLIRYSQVNLYNSIPQHFTSFGRSNPKQNPEIVRSYIPYLARQLKESIEKNELTRSHVFIRALGNIAHPKILNVFEPYLKRKIHATTFQRLLMVFSLNNLAARLKPAVSHNIFYGIYEDTSESDRLRSAAVAFLISTNPPASMLRRMAEFTHHDHSRQVNAAVKSAIQSASKLVTPESQDLAKKARNVLSILNDESFDNENTNNVFSDYDSSVLNLGYRMQAYLSTDAFTKLDFFASVQARYGDYEVPKSEIAILLSGLKKISDLRRKKYNSDHREVNENMEYTLEKIGEMLKLKKEDDENLEGLFWANNEYNNQFLSFDERTLERIPDFLLSAGKRFMEGHNFNMAKMESYDLTLSLPMESGFPFVYTRKVPTMIKLTGSGKGEQSLDFNNGTIEIRLVYSMQIQGRLGFLTPFNRQHYMAGVNKNSQLYAPIRIKAGFDNNDRRITVKFEPIEQTESYRLAHHSLIPFTSRHNILSISPVINLPNAEKLINGKTWHRANRIRNLKYEMETDSARRDGMDRSNWDPIARSLFALAEDDPEYSKNEIYFEPDKSSEQSVILTGLFNYKFNETIPYNETRSKANPKATAPVVENQKLYDSERGMQLMEKAAEGISYSLACSLDLGVEISGEEPSQMLLTAAYATSLIDEKSRGLVYWRVVDPLWFIEFETCAGMEFKTPRMDGIKIGDKYFYKDKDVYRNFDIDLRIGTTCVNANRIQIHVDQEQTEQYKKSVGDMRILSVCMKDIAAGGVSTPACKDAGNKIYAMDNSTMIIKFDEQFTDFEDEVPKYLAIINSIPYLNSSIMKKTRDQSIANNVLKFSMNVDPIRNIANLSCENSELRLTAEDVKIPHGILIANLHHDLSDVSERVFMNLIDDNPRPGSCEFQYTMATTFDNVTYPVEFGDCWHLATSNYLMKDIVTPDNGPPGMLFGVFVKNSNGSDNNSNKDVLIVTGSDEIRFEFVDNETLVTINGEAIDLSQRNNSYNLSQFMLLQLPDNIVEFVYPIYNFVVRYNGTRIQIWASENYRNKIRGLCGNYDDNSTNDFMSPKGGVLSTGTEFVAAFALNSSDCGTTTVG